MTDSIVTAEQAAYFDTFGFLVLRRAFNAAEMNTITREFDRLLDAERGGAPFPGVKRQSLYGVTERSPLLLSLVDDDRTYGVAEALMGPGLVWLNSEGNLYVGDTDWHPDGSRLAYPPMKISLYLEPVTRETGCLRVLPGSHRQPFHSSLEPVSRLGLQGRDLPSYPCETEPGDVMFMNMNLWHASFGGRTGRRHLAVNFAPAPATPEHFALLGENYQAVLKFIGQLQYGQTGRATTDAFLKSDRPRLRALASLWNERGWR